MSDTAIQGEKRWVASFMVDLVGSTELTEKLGAEKTFVLMQGLMKAAVRIIESFGGYYVEYAGDSVFALFGAPVAIENATLNACRAAFALHENLAAQEHELMATYGVTPQYRVGVAVGEVLVAALSMSDHKRINALGSAVNISARIQALAGPGEVYCSHSAIEEIEGYAETQLVGDFELKGIQGAQKIYRLTALHDERTSLEARMQRGSGHYVGRADQVEEIHRWLVADMPPSRVMTVIGTPGIGKSRIVRKVLNGLLDTIQVNIAYCAPNDANNALKAVLALISDAAKSDQAREPEELKRWLPTFLGGHPPSADLLELLGGVRGGSAAVQDERDMHNAILLRSQIVTIVRALSSQPNRRLVIEDTHWLDGLSREVLSEALSEAPPLTRILMTSRAEEGLGAGPDGQHDVTIRPLSQEDINALVAAAYPELDAPREVQRQIFLKSEGNPLFAEELLRHLAPDATNQGVLQLPSGMEIGSIQNLVFSRFDALNDVEKATLKAAAFLGRVIKHAHLEHITGDKAVVHEVLEMAAQKGLVEPAPGSAHWRFSHILMQEAIANSVPSVEAAQLHAQAAETLLAVEVDAASKLAPNLAHHFDQAGMHGKALEFHVRASQTAWRVSALDVCMTHLERAESLICELGSEAPNKTVSEMVQRYLRVLDVVGNWTKARRIGQAYLPRMQQMQDPHSLTIVLTLLAKAANQCSDFDTSIVMIEQALAKAQEAGDEHALGIAKTVKMDILNDLPNGDYHEVRALFEETREYTQSGRDPHMARMRLYEMAAYHRQIGDIQAAQRTADELVALGVDKNYAPALSMGWWVKASISAMIEDLPESLAAANQSMQYALEGTMDYSTAHVFSMGAAMMAGSGGVTNEELENISRQRTASGDASVAIIAAFYSSALYFMHGKIRAGLTQLNYTQSLIDLGAERGLVQQYYFKKTDLMLTVAGLLPSPLGAPKVPLAEIPAAIKLRLNARKLAAQALKDLQDRIVTFEGFHQGRLDMSLGLLAKGQERKTLISQAVAEFERQGLITMTDMAREALAKH